jgi:hypothetical protein
MNWRLRYLGRCPPLLGAGGEENRQWQELMRNTVVSPLRSGR